MTDKKMLRAALTYAERHWPVFPLVPNDKIPLISKEDGGHGCLDATCDAGTILDWWGRYPDANIGLATGADSGFWVLDCDRHDAASDGIAALLDLEKINGTLPLTLVQETPSGGTHHAFRLADIDIGNRAGIAPGLDTRGTGGYIVAEPSMYGGKQYKWRRDVTTLSTAPAWLEKLVTKQKEVVQLRESKHIDTYVNSAFVRVLAELTNARPGMRNDALNRAAFSLGNFVGAGSLGYDQCEAALRSAAASVGLQDSEASRTIKSGLESGIRDPRAMPEQKTFKQPEPSAALHLEWFQHIQPSTATTDFIEGVLPSGSLSIVYGAPGTGKTFFVLDAALHVALGRRWMGRDVKAGGVLYCCLEGIFGFRNRVSAFREHYGLQDSTMPFASISSPLNLRGSADDARRLIQAIKDAEQQTGQKIDLVTIDTLSRSLAGGDENMSSDLGAVIRHAQSVVDATGTHLLMVHHSGKDRARGPRGHSILSGNVDVMIEITREPGSSTSVASSIKQRDLEPFDDIAFSLRSVQVGTNSRGKSINSCVIEQTAPPDLTESTMGEQRDMRLMQKSIIHEIHEMVAVGRCRFGVVPEQGMPSVTVVDKRDLWSWLKRRGFVSVDENGEVERVSRTKLVKAFDLLRQTHKIGILDESVWLIP